MKETYLTKEGLTDLQHKLHELKTVRRREIADAIHSAKEQGDLSENAEYVNAKEEQTRIEQQIAELEMTVKNARIITKSNTSIIDVGNTVTLNCAGSERVYRIVGSNEADPLKGRISNESPVGRALLNKKKGDIVLIPTPAGDKECHIVKIS
ncbi:MAG: transcription elongation factor GreA [Candidatus Andersenbacteria bacterium]